jgi:hypothetical protein
MATAAVSRAVFASPVISDRIPDPLKLTGPERKLRGFLWAGPSSKRRKYNYRASFVQGKQGKPRKIPWISLDSFGRIGTFQWVTPNPNQKNRRTLKLASQIVLP